MNNSSLTINLNLSHLLQMYKGLDIVTNKVTPEERNLVKHHLLDFVDPLSKLNVVDFRNLVSWHHFSLLLSHWKHLSSVQFQFVY